MASNLRGIPLSKISPQFLHANSTSHTWVFSAFAEIIDNAYDPDVSASELLIDKVDIRNVPCLIFLDNGAGMDRDKLHKMLSFGFCEKDIYESSASHQPIGHYGNGFKSGSMRIGTDALVFTRSEHSASIGFLSQTYLTASKAESVFVPILDYRLPKLERIKSQESRNNLNAILTYSVFKFEEELKAELRALEGSKTGTKIIISNLRRLESGSLELDFSSDPTDVRCPEAHEADMTSVYHRPVEQYISEYKLSLREYCSILFLKPRMKITIRGQRVKSKLISKSLSQSEQDSYSPSWLTKTVKIIFGFTCDKEKSEDYGLMLYHRNRLIKAFERVGYQKQPNEKGVGVVGVAQVNFLQPIHNKQDFKWDEKFNSVMKAFATKLNEYWNEKVNPGNPSSSQPKGNLPDWTWAQCDHCLKWRRLPDSINPKSLPDKWYCRYNRDGTHNRCDIPEEPEDEDMAVKPRFEKTFKKKQEEQKRLQRLRQIEEETKKKQEMERQLKQKEEELRALQRMKQPRVDRRAHDLELALADAQRCIEEQARLMNQMASGTFPSPPPVKNGQQNGSKFAANSMPIPPMQSQQMKRRATVESLPTKENKKLCIKTETGEVLSITRNFADDEEVNEQDMPNTTVVKKTPGKSKGAPLKVSMPFPSTKTNHGTEKLKEVNGVKGKRDPSITAKPPASSKEKSQKYTSKLNNTSSDIIDLTCDSENFTHPVIKSDPDGKETSSSQEPMDMKPDKESLDAQMRDNIENNLNNEKPSSTQGFSSHSESADKQQDNISETIESNLETALAAIRERADKEKLGTAPTSSSPHQGPVASSEGSTVEALGTVQSNEPCSASPHNNPEPNPEATAEMSLPVQAVGPETDEPQKSPAATSQNKNVDSPCAESSSSAQCSANKSVTTEQGPSSNVENTQALTKLDEPSQTLEFNVTDSSASKTVCEAAENNQINKNVQNEDEEICDTEEFRVGKNLQKHSITRDGGPNAQEIKSTSPTSEIQNPPEISKKQVSIREGSENGPLGNGDKSSKSGSCSQTNNQSIEPENTVASRQDTSIRKQSHKSSTVTAEKDVRQDKSSDKAETGQSKSSEQLPQAQTSQASKVSGSEADKSLSSNVISRVSASCSDTTVHTNDSRTVNINDVDYPKEQLNCSSKSVSNNDVVANHSTSHTDFSPQHSPLKAVSSEKYYESNDDAVPCEPLPSNSVRTPESRVHAGGDCPERDINSQVTPLPLRTNGSKKMTCSVHVQTEMDSTQDKLKTNIYRLLQLLAPGKDLGDIHNIDKLLEDMIRDKEHAFDSQFTSLSGDSQE